MCKRAVRNWYTLWAIDNLRFRKKLLFSYKNDRNWYKQIIDRKLKENEAQYDLDRKTAKISALSSGNLHEYEYLIGEDLRYKSSVVEQAKFDYFPLGKVLNRGLDQYHKKRKIIDKAKNIEDKN